MIRKLWAKLVAWGWDYSYELTDKNRSDDTLSIHVLEDDSVDMKKAVKFSILPARGGCVFESRTFNNKEHEWDTITHVIPDGTDVAEAVGKIVAMEMLKR